MKALQALTLKYRELADEKSSLSQKAEYAKRAIDDVIDHGNIESPKQQTRLGDARFSLDMATSRIKAINRELPKLEDEIARLYDSERAAFNSKLKSLRDKLETDLKAALLPFFDGKPMLVQRLLQGVNVPALHDISRCMEPCLDHERMKAIVQTASHFCAHVTKVTNLLNLPDQP
jgi:hypothetical protein